jgi:hypothetical protein
VTALLVLGIVSAALTAISLWPPHRPGAVALIAFFLGWPVSELPLHAAIVEVALAIAFATHTGVSTPADGVGLALVGASLLGLIHHVRLATATTQVI